MATRIPIRMWRMSRPEKGPGMFVWFDPDREELELRQLEPPKESGVGDPCEGDDPVGTSPAPDQEQRAFIFDEGLPF